MASPPSSSIIPPPSNGAHSSPAQFFPASAPSSPRFPSFGCSWSSRTAFTGSGWPRQVLLPPGAWAAQALRMIPQTVRAMGIGIAVAVFSLAYVCLFYAAGQRLGVWCPVEIGFLEDLSAARCHGSMPMQTGFSAAFNEEMLFRAGRSPAALVKLFRVRWLAVLISAAAWAFYAQQLSADAGIHEGDRADRRRHCLGLSVMLRLRHRRHA